MRVGLVVPGFSADQTDWCIPALRHFARELARDDDVRVIAVRYPYRGARYQLEGAEVIAIGGATSRGPASFDVWRRTFTALRAEHRARPFDVLHAFWATESGLLAALVGRWLRIPTLVSLAGGELVSLPDIGYGDQRLAWERLKVGATLRLAGALSAGSLQLLEWAQRYLQNRYVRKRLHHAPLGVDLQLFSPDPATRSGTPRVLHAGALVPVKDQATLLRAFAKVRHGAPSATLDIVGDGPLRHKLERLACELSIASAVTFQGEVDHGALPGAYRAGRVCVVSSRHEAQCMVAVEAASCGLPVVGTYVGALPELAESAEDLVSVGAVDALAGALARALDMSAGGDSTARERVRQRFNLADCTENFRSLYASVSA